MRAKQLVLKSAQSPKKAWESAIAEFTKNPSSKTKCCPKGACLGLCEAGVISGISAGRYGPPVSNKNGEYALVAWRELQSEPSLSRGTGVLWARVTGRVPDPPENPNGQMDVVVCL